MTKKCVIIEPQGFKFVYFHKLSHYTFVVFHCQEISKLKVQLTFQSTRLVNHSVDMQN